METYSYAPNRAVINIVDIDVSIKYAAILNRYKKSKYQYISWKT